MKLKKLWPYSKDNKSTWKYIDVEIGGAKRDGVEIRFVRKWVLNPDFIYKHLDPEYKMREKLQEQEK